LEEGAGAPVVFLHGASLGSSARAFERNLPAFAGAGFRAIAYDQPGFGLTDNPIDYAASYRTQFIVKFLDAIDASRAALVGHSQAAGMAARVAYNTRAFIIGRRRRSLPPLPGKTAATGRGRGTSTTDAGRHAQIMDNNFPREQITTGFWAGLKMSLVGI
jgi:pimeloyl-ACP methyl ester carboxylesterase